VELIEANFIDLNLPNREFDVIIASDVFEHVLREDEKEFVKKCLKLLRPGGTLVVSMPNLGTFAWLDPYQIKPLLHWLRWRIGLPQALHNGFCDIRKGHKHYTVAEIANSFEPLVISRVEYWGYCFDPILSWWEALSNRLGFQMPGQTWLSRLCVSEYSRDFGDRSFNIAVQLKKQNRD
jgi:SAM-dependent methyltransferase